MKIDEIIQQPGQRELDLKRSVLECLHVAVPGYVKTYNAVTRTATIQPTIREWGERNSPPLLLDVPVFFPGNFTFDVNAGDECLVVFADRCIDAWFQNGGISPAMTARMHDMSDGFAFVGFSSRKNVPAEAVNLTEVIADFERRITVLEGGGNS